MISGAPPVVGEMLEHVEGQHAIEAPVLVAQVRGVALLHVFQSLPPAKVDGDRREVHAGGALVAEPLEKEEVVPRPAAHIEDARGPLGEMPLEEEAKELSPPLEPPVVPSSSKIFRYSLSCTGASRLQVQVLRRGSRPRRGGARATHPHRRRR